MGILRLGKSDQNRQQLFAGARIAGACGISNDERILHFFSVVDIKMVHLILGFMVSFLADPVLSGFTTAAAIAIGTAQV